MENEKKYQKHLINNNKIISRKIDRIVALKSSKAITLITLVITIVLLIILAGVTINVSVGKNGIFSKAKYAKERYELAQIKEKVELEILDIEIREANSENDVTIELVLQELLENNTFDSINIAEGIGYIGKYEVKLKYSENNKVIVEYVKEATGMRATYVLEPKSYTNKANVNIIFKVYGKVKTVTKPDGEKIHPSQDPEEIVYNVTSNGNYTFIIENEEGKREEKNVIVNTIDMLPPTITEVAVEQIRTGIKVNVTAEDAQANETSVKSGIEKYEYYAKLTTESEYTKYDTNEIKSLPEGTYQVYVIAYDKAGNPSDESRVQTVEVEGWTEIWDEEDLRNIANNLKANYIVMQDIEVQNEWEPLGNFEGKLDGDGHKISKLNFEKTSENEVGLFNRLRNTSEVKNLKLQCEFIGVTNVGGIAGLSEGTIENIQVEGTIQGSNRCGGIIGQQQGGKIINVNFSGTVKASNGTARWNYW